MYVFPGNPMSIAVNYQLGGEPVSPSISAYQVVDKSGVVQDSQAITVPPGQNSVYVVVPGTTNTLPDGEKYRQLRADVTYTADNAMFVSHHLYYVVPDLFLGFDARVANQVLGVGEEDLPTQPDYYRAYIDLASSPIGDLFYSALMGSNLDNATTARNLILYSACLSLLPTLQMNIYKSAQSETSQFSRFDVDFAGIKTIIENKYALYYAQIQVLGAPLPLTTLIVLDSPSDPVTGGS